MQVVGDNFISGRSTVTISPSTGLTFSQTVGGPTFIDLDITVSGSAAIGTRTVQVTTSSPGGGLSNTKTLTINAPAPPPPPLAAPSTPNLAPVDDTGSSNADNVTRNTSNLTLTGTAPPNSTVILYDGSAVLTTTIASFVGSWNRDVTLAAGTHSIKATATNNSQTSPDSGTLSITVDTSAPTNQNTVFASDRSVQTGASVPIVSSGTATNRVWLAPAGTTAFTTGNTITLAASGTATSILAPATAGSYKLFVMDLAGNVSSASAATLTAFVPDAVAPQTGSLLVEELTQIPPLPPVTAPLTTVGSASYARTNDVGVTFSGTDNIGVTSFQCRRDGGTFASCTSPHAFSGLSNGSHTVEVVARDAAGNVDPTPAASTFIVDTVVPTGAVSINDGAASTSSSVVTLALTCADANGCARMRVAVDGNIDGEAAEPFAPTKQVTLPAGAGTRTVKVRFIDPARNPSAEASDTIESLDVAPNSTPPAPLTSGFIETPLFCAGISIGTSAICGDGVKGIGETCEIGETQSVPCGSNGFLTQACINASGTCRFQSDAEATATGATCRQPSCGNGVREGVEECDDGSLNGTFGHCGPDCSIAGGFYCGNGLVEGPEQCDRGAANGQYNASMSVSCTFDCKKPGPSCGDKVVNGTEVCDGDSQTYGGKLCRGGSRSNESCETHADCPAISNGCGGTTTTNACPTNTLRVRACSGSCIGFNAWSICGATCGNGILEGSEQCDDGNQEDDDACTAACQPNVCGDGKIFAGTESCDDGAQNGAECTAPYGGVCNYCTVSCQFRTKSGGFCGDNTKNGPEACDGSDVQIKTCVHTATRVLGGACLLNADCDTGETCLSVGACNGGGEANNGKSCVPGGSPGCGGGTCVAPSCSNSCGAACPSQFVTTSINIQSELPGTSPTSEIDLFSFQNEGGSTPDNATLLLPACRVGVGLTADIDRSKVVPPSIDIVFVTDMSGSMRSLPSGGNQLASPPGRKIDIVADSTRDAINTLLDSFEEDGVDARIGLVAFGNSYGPNGFSEDVPLSPASARTTMIEKINEYPSRIVNTRSTMYAGVKRAIDMLNASGRPGGPADIKVLISLSDGDVTSRKDLSSCTGYSYTYGGNSFSGNNACVAEVVKELITEHGLDDASSISFYSAAITSNATGKGLISHVSSDTCGTNITSRADCVPRQSVEYAYDAQDAAGIAAMYQAITNSVLGANVGLTATAADGTTAETSGSVPEGKGQPLRFPARFFCNGQAVSMPFNIGFNSSPNTPSTINVKNVKFTYCPAR